MSDAPPPRRRGRGYGESWPVAMRRQLDGPPPGVTAAGRRPRPEIRRICVSCGELFEPSALERVCLACDPTAS